CLERERLERDVPTTGVDVRRPVQPLEVCAHVLVLVDHVLPVCLTQAGENLQPPLEVREESLTSSLVSSPPVGDNELLEQLALLRPEAAELQPPAPFYKLIILFHHVLGERHGAGYQDQVHFPTR